MESPNKTNKYFPKKMMPPLLFPTYDREITSISEHTPEPLKRAEADYKNKLGFSLNFS